MPIAHLDPKVVTPKDSWEGNNAAFTCRECGWVFLVSGRLHKKGRPCQNPECGKSTGHVIGGKTSKGTAWIGW
jgi:hypothetical protein